MHEPAGGAWFPVFGNPGPPRRPARRRTSRPSSNLMTSEDYFQVALEILAEHGPEALTTAALCERSKVTKGSFYYHFRGIDEFVQAFADHLELVLNEVLSAALSAPDPLARISSAINLFARLPHAAMAAVRAWGKSNPMIEASERRLDRACVNAGTSVLTAVLEDHERAALISRQLFAMMIGLQLLERQVDPSGDVRLLSSFIAMSCGLEARITEIDGGATVEFSRIAAPRHP
jgi:AcrR family transcriptional regulator